MSRLLFLIIIGIVVYLLMKSFRARISKDEHRQTEDMVRCTYCGVHLPAHESILAGGKYYCSEAHRRAHSDTPDKS